MTSFVPGAIGGSGLPIIKADAKSGRFTFDGEAMTEIQFIADLENAEAGWLRFSKNMAPDFRLVRVDDLLAGTKPYPTAPNVLDHEGKPAYRRGFRLMVKLSPKVAAGKPLVRELASNSLVMSTAIDDLLRAWHGHPERAPGKLPRVGVKSWIEVKGPQGSNYQPRLEIWSVVDRPADLKAPDNPDAPDAPEEFPDD